MLEFVAPSLRHVLEGLERENAPVYQQKRVEEIFARWSGLAMDVATWNGCGSLNMGLSSFLWADIELEI